MSLSIAISQIQKPSFWGQPASEKAQHQVNINRANIESLVKETERLIAKAGRPVMMYELAESLCVSLMTVRGIGTRLVDTGKYSRIKINDHQALALSNFMRNHHPRGEMIRQKIVDVLKKYKRLSTKEISFEIGLKGNGLRHHLRILEQIGKVKHVDNGLSYIYSLGDAA